eukprot:NODE_535_length_1635_cov_41.878310_g444_i0.p1 GENE.NODE_535_length_1635_cov_41.878310_g444_i0~~NODE_535_length_1635_cov_41.878310_g444_i0.p1  ORF type:complete len:449 (+),score=89.95 NODE_535_length_1635_cov_41.878310_g444_i0:117-1463(+)
MVYGRFWKFSKVLWSSGRVVYEHTQPKPCVHLLKTPLPTPTPSSPIQPSHPTIASTHPSRPVPDNPGSQTEIALDKRYCLSSVPRPLHAFCGLPQHTRRRGVCRGDCGLVLTLNKSEAEEVASWRAQLRPKVAMAVSGGMRTYKQTFDTWKKRLLLHNPDVDFDMYIASSNPVDTLTGHDPNAQRCSDHNQLHEFYGNVLKKIQCMETNEMLFPLSEFYNENWHFGMQFSMMWQSQLMVHRSGKNYNLVLRMRPDGWLLGSMRIIYIPPNAIAVVFNLLPRECHVPYNARQHMFCCKADNVRAYLIRQNEIRSTIAWCPGIYLDGDEPDDNLDGFFFDQFYMGTQSIMLRMHNISQSYHEEQVVYRKEHHQQRWVEAFEGAVFRMAANAGANICDMGQHYFADSPQALLREQDRWTDLNDLTCATNWTHKYYTMVNQTVHYVRHMFDQ